MSTNHALDRSNASGDLKWKPQWRCSVNAAVRRMNMNLIPNTELTIAVPSDEVASFLRNGTVDSRISSVAQRIQIDIGNGSSVTEPEPRVFASINRATSWLGATEVEYLYTLSDRDDFSTHIDIAVMARPIKNVPLALLVN